MRATRHRGSILIAVVATAFTSLVAVSAANAHDERLDRWFEQQRAQSDGNTLSMPEQSAREPAGTQGRAGIANMDGDNRDLGCFLIELQRGESYQPSAAEMAACESSRATGPKQSRAFAATWRKDDSPR